jgi:two-component system CheB/CheR fusion protein
MAFVIIQHLDTTQKGIMPELLQRATGMEVSQVRDRMRVRPDCAYVIPPNKDMSILHGVLHLFEPAAPRGVLSPSISFSAPWPKTGGRPALASSFLAWARTA